jgi:PadR family transcriptional regulator, regulatory protein AphA
MPKVNKTKYAILGVLNRDPSSGYDIKKFSDEHIAYFWNENYGHIYPVLKVMEKERLIEKKTEYTEGKPARNIFSITEKGKTELNGWLDAKTEPCIWRNEFLLKLVFSKDMPAEKIAGKFMVEKKKAEVKLEELCAIEKKMLEKPDFKVSKVRKLWLIALRYGIFDVKAKIVWCDEALDRLKEIGD